MNVLKSQKGFTLIELVIGMAILTIILSAIVGVFAASIKSHQYNFDEGANIQDARSILDSASNELRNANMISAPAAVNVHASSITYRLPGDTADRSIRMGTASDAGYVVFTDAAGSIRRLGTGRIASIDFVYANVPAGSAPPCKRLITIRVQVKNPSRTNAPLSDITTSVVTFNSF